MSILRQDPTTKDWVIIATDRGKRPDDFQRTFAESALPIHDPACPFCPGQEKLTPRLVRDELELVKELVGGGE